MIATISYLVGSIILFVVSMNAAIRADTRGEPVADHMAFAIASLFFILGSGIAMVNP